MKIGKELKEFSCNGCGACAAVCPHKAISMKEDKEGFLYPEINESLCVKCELCEKTCPLNKSTIECLQSVEVLSAYHKDDQIRYNSSSGGLFSAFAKCILEQNGCVVGAAFDESFNVKHVMVENEEDLSILRGSKYVQSSIDRSLYHLIRDKLKDNCPVLFSGTPCQVAGLKSFLGKDYKTLYCVDLICHGVPSPGVWADYLKELQSKHNKKMESISFRSKKNGWKEFSTKYVYSDGSVEEEVHYSELFTKGFLRNLYLRPSCANCKFKAENYYSDLTMADLWGADYIEGVDNDDKGLSLLILRTDKGKTLLNNAKQNIESKPIKTDVAFKYNPAINNSAEMHERRKKFFSKFRKMNVEILIKKSFDISITERIRNKIKRTLLNK